MLTKLKKSNNRNSKGFTIIEVMIVLAIAGLIILIVLLAVPALQRTGRNTAIKQDAAAIAGGVGEFASNNDGARPDAATTNIATAGHVKLANATAGTTATDTKIQASTTVVLGADDTAATVTPKNGELTVTFGTKCDPAGPASASTFKVLVSKRSTAIVYAIETAGASQSRCLDS